MAEIIKSAEVDKNYFWHRLKQVRKDQSISVNTIKYTNHATIHDIDGILQTWNTNFDTLSKPKDLPEYDNEHFAHVNDFFREKIKMTHLDRFTKDYFNPDEISIAIKKLKKVKHWDTIILLVNIYNMQAPQSYFCSHSCTIYICITIDYVPRIFKVVIQVPLYKGKNTCSLEPSNYRGITLLLKMSKIFEMIIWARIEPWWVNDHTIT